MYFPSAPVTLELSDISFKYSIGDRHARAFSLAQCNISARAGETMGILGPSGAGKSTLLSIIAGHLRPTTGAVRLRGRDITQVRAGLRRIVTVFQEDSLFPHLTVEQNVAYGIATLQRHSEIVASTRAEHYLRRFGLFNHRTSSPAALSVGEKQRVALCRALVAEPQVLLLDEPTASLDCIQRDVLMDLLRETLQCEKGPTIIIVSHDRDFALDLCPTIAVLDEGKVLCQGEREDLLAVPPSRRVAQILGGHFILDGQLESESMFRLSDGVPIPIKLSGRHAPAERNCSILIRKSEISLDNREHTSPCQITGRIVRITPSPLCSLVEVEIGRQIRIQIPSTGAQHAAYAAGDTISLWLSETAVQVVGRSPQSADIPEVALN